MATINEYGTCCVCQSDMEMYNIIQLDYKVESESGWGCFKCGLPMQGAVAVVCDGCLDEHGNDIEDQIRFLMDGVKGRIPVPPVADRIPHEHDLSLHPECIEEEDDEGDKMGIENITKLELFEMRRSVVNESNKLDPDTEEHENLEHLVLDIDRVLLEKYDAVYPDDEVFRL